MSDPKALAIKLAHIYYHTGSWEKAILEYEKITGMDPNDWGVRYTLGECYLKKGDLEKAYKEFEASASGFMRDKNIKKASGSYREMANIIQKLFEPTDVEKAKDLYRDIISRLPDSEDAIRNLRDLFQRHNENAEAVRYTLRLGDLYNKLDYIDKAENEYLKALALEPGNEGARQKLAQLREEMSKSQEDEEEPPPSPASPGLI
jgi:tetratricopeptide (TPR) repeat protein